MLGVVRSAIKIKESNLAAFSAMIGKKIIVIYTQNSYIFGFIFECLFGVWFKRNIGKNFKI